MTPATARGTAADPVSRTHSSARKGGYIQLHTVLGEIKHWMDAGASTDQKLAVPTDLKIIKLSDEFGQYTLVLQCTACRHERHAQPHALARLCGWDASIEDVARRLRCSKCGKKQCVWRAYPPSKPRGHSSLPR